jgi:hypothetical protein
MQPRERLLAVGLGLVVGGIFVYWAYGQYISLFSNREATLTTVSRQVAAKEGKMAAIQKAIVRRRELEKRSLPTNATDAENRYHDWLLSLINGKLAEPSVTPRAARAGAKGYLPLDFEVKGEGTLEQVTKFLHDFYSANHLHQVTSLVLKPLDKSGKLGLTMQVQAIILPGADRKDSLTTEPGDNLALDSYSDYQKAVVGRNLFAEYKPPSAAPVVARSTEPTFDLAKLAYFTTLLESNGKPEAWLTERNVNKRTRLYEGDEFQVAGVKGTVKRINLDDRYVELEVDGKPVIVSQHKSLGDTLADRQKTQK